MIKLITFASCLLSATFASQSLAMKTNSTPLSCSLVIETKSITQVTLRLSLTNTESKPLYLDKAATPFEGWNTRFIKVSKNNEALPYLGRTIKPAASQYPNDFIAIEPQASITVSINLSPTYSVLNSGQYNIEYSGIFTIKRSKAHAAELLFPECSNLQFTMP